MGDHAPWAEFFYRTKRKTKETTEILAKETSQQLQMHNEKSFLSVLSLMLSTFVPLVLVSPLDATSLKEGSGYKVTGKSYTPTCHLFNNRRATYAASTHADFVISALFAKALTQPHSAGPGHHHCNRSHK